MTEWKTYKLSELVEIKYGKDHKHLADGEIPLYGSGGIMRYVDTPLYEQESILIPRKGTLSNLFYLNIPFWSVDTMFYTKIKAGNNGKYLYYLLKSMNLASMNVGSAVPSLTTEVLNKVEITVPDLATQTQIAQILTSLDDKIELNLQMNQTLEAMAQALFKEWFVNFNCPNHDSLDLLDEKDFEKKNQKEKKQGNQDNPKNHGSDNLPKGWRKLNLSDLVETVSKTFKFPDGKAIFLNTSDILEGKFLHTNYTNYEDLPGQAKKSIQNGDILFSEIRPANKRYAFVDFDAKDYVVSTKLMVLRSKGLVDNLLVYFFIKSDEVLNQLQSLAETRSGTFPQITYTELTKIEINIPTDDILIKFTEFLKSSFKKIRENQQQIQTLTQNSEIHYYQS